MDSRRQSKSFLAHFLILNPIFILNSSLRPARSTLCQCFGAHFARMKVATPRTDAYFQGVSSFYLRGRMDDADTKRQIQWNASQKYHFRIILLPPVDAGERRTHESVIPYINCDFVFSAIHLCFLSSHLTWAESGRERSVGRGPWPVLMHLLLAFIGFIP